MGTKTLKCKTVNLKKQTPDIIYIQGYKIILFPIKNSTVQVNACVNSGYINETKESLGENHFFEHFLVQSWKKCKRTCMELWNEEGADVNASTSGTKLHFYIFGLKKLTFDMIDYIVEITTHFPKSKPQNIDIEKMAIKNELLMHSMNSDNLLYNVYCKNLFLNNGLQERYNMLLQVKNLEKLNTENIKKIFESKFTNKNVVYIITGDFIKKDIIRYFQSKLHPSPVEQKNKQILPDLNSIFTRKNEIIFVPFKTAKITKILIGFPVNIKMNEVDYFTMLGAMNILEKKAFFILREEKKLIYGLEISHVTEFYGSLINITLYVMHENVSKTLQSLFRIISNFKLNVPEELITVEKKRNKLLYSNQTINATSASKFIIDQMMGSTEKNSLLSYTGIFRKKQNITQKTCQMFFLKYFDLKTCLIVYLSVKKLKI
jgi:predicted Zn-dependent peptidase